jgi:nitroreductase
MTVIDAIKKRRAYRSLEKIEITEEVINELIEGARLSPSCFNNQPWRYVFVYENEMLEKMFETLSKGNEWATRASMIIAVFSREDFDCQIYDRTYNLFDTGMATAFMILRATELGLVAHPIAGYSPKKVRAVLGIPDEMKVIALVIVGKHSMEINELLSEKQIEDEKHRPERSPIDELFYMNSYSGESGNE